jgi:hypothetical protein
MTTIAIIVAAEATQLFVARAKRNRMQRQQILMGHSQISSCGLPFIHDYLKRKAAGANSLQRLAASRMAEVCRRLVRTPSFEYLLLQVIRTANLKLRNKRFISQRRVAL